MEQLEFVKNSSIQHMGNVVDPPSANSSRGSRGTRCRTSVTVFRGSAAFCRLGFEMCQSISGRHRSQPDEIILSGFLAPKDYALSTNSETEVIYQYSASVIG